MDVAVQCQHWLAFLDEPPDGNTADMQIEWNMVDHPAIQGSTI